MSVAKLIAGLLMIMVLVACQSAEAAGRGRSCRRSARCYSQCRPCAPTESSPVRTTTLQNQINVLQQQIIDLDTRLQAVEGQ